MEIIVCLKQVPDLGQIRIKRETREPVLEGLPLVFGDMDKNALEEAVRIKEQHGATLTALSVAPSPKLKETLIEALAMGADEAVAVIDPLFAGSDAPRSAKALAQAIQRIERYDLILLGEGSADEYSCEIPSRLAELLGLPQITYVRELELIEGGIRAVRDLEEALEVVEAPFPVLLSVTSEINEPRLPSMTDILKASRKPLQEWKAADIGLSADELGEEALEVISNLAPKQERKNRIIEGDVAEVVDRLVDSLIQEGVC
ncbi:MAG: electron transfer flavoprotein subunit beta/FixA family protein [Candidatus Bipolaricaulia bacterium]